MEKLGANFYLAVIPRRMVKLSASTRKLAAFFDFSVQITKTTRHVTFLGPNMPKNP